MGYEKLHGYWLNYLVSAVAVRAVKGGVALPWARGVALLRTAVRMRVCEADNAADRKLAEESPAMEQVSGLTSQNE
jgi:hypothetical protein